MLNNRGAADARDALTGKDGVLFNDKGVMLATIDSYQAQVSVNNAKHQPCGDAQEHEVFSSFGVTLTFSEVLVRDEALIREFMEGLKTGQMPNWGFQGLLRGRRGNEERVNYRGCVPSGTIDLQNVSPGDIIKRSWSFAVNEPPEMQKFL